MTDIADTIHEHLEHIPTMAESLNGKPFDFLRSSSTVNYCEWLALAFARRVVQGEAKDYECEFMCSLMAMELPERNILGDCITAYNLTAICNGIEERDCSSFEELFESWQVSVPTGAGAA